VDSVARAVTPDVLRRALGPISRAVVPGAATNVGQPAATGGPRPAAALPPQARALCDDDDAAIRGSYFDPFHPTVGVDPAVLAAVNEQSIHRAHARRLVEGLRDVAHATQAVRAVGSHAFWTEWLPTTLPPGVAAAACTPAPQSVAVAGSGLLPGASADGTGGLTPRDDVAATSSSAIGAGLMPTGRERTASTAAALVTSAAPAASVTTAADGSATTQAPAALLARAAAAERVRAELRYTSLRWVLRRQDDQSAADAAAMEAQRTAAARDAKLKAIFEAAQRGDDGPTASAARRSTVASSATGSRPGTRAPNGSAMGPRYQAAGGARSQTPVSRQPFAPPPPVAVE
jgi:hypothetical protein